jgi:hypothetical protein
VHLFLTEARRCAILLTGKDTELSIRGERPREF